jgi:hypothetical protein
MASLGERPQLERILAEELAQEIPAGARALAGSIRQRQGDAVAAVLFYGSCLRRNTCEGVLDFYVLVDSYRSAYRSRALVLANALLPPNVFYHELRGPAGTLRAKYAVLSTRDFVKAMAPRRLDGRVWARFCQPAALVYARDDAIRRVVVGAVAQAVLTALERALTWLPGDGDVQRFRATELWNAGFRETYRSELRSESPETIRSLVASDPERYERVAREALRLLAARGRIELREEEGGGLTIVSSAASRRRRRRLARLRRPFSKTLAVLGLVKTAGTFGDWVPYVIWKLERHSGASIHLSERQRRHPLVLGWPVLFRLLRARVLR